MREKISIFFDVATAMSEADVSTEIQSTTAGNDMETSDAESAEKICPLMAQYSM